MISVITAMDRNGLIGNGDKLPWHVSDELRHFRQMTEGHICIFGYKTFFDSFNGKPLKNRINIVINQFRINHQPLCDKTVHRYYKWEDALGFCHRFYPQKKIFICGGCSVYSVFLPFADEVIISQMKGNYEGNIYFPWTLQKLYTEFNCKSWDASHPEFNKLILEREYK